MNPIAIGIVVGVLLAIAAGVGGLGIFLLAVILGAVGGALGAHFAGLIDLGALISRVNRG